MGQPAARVGDTTSHGTPLAPGPGCPTVLIGGQPAWRATVGHARVPAVGRPKPHVGGVVAVGQRDGDDRRPAGRAAGRHGRRSGRAQRDRAGRADGDDRMSAERSRRASARTSSAAAGRCRCELDPRTGRVASVAYEDDIRQSILIILETAPGERVMRPNFGCGIHELVFAALDSTALQRIRSVVEEALRRCEARIEVLGVNVDEDADRRGQAARRDRVSRAQDEPDRQPRLPVLLPRGRPAVKAPRAPRLESAARAEFAAELRERARAWIPSWGLDDGERDFGRALLEIAARFSSEVAERLDGAGEKMRRGFLDWLAVRGEAARPARMPVVFKLADTAREAVLAPAPVRMQADAAGTPVVFETENDVRVVPGRLDVVVGVDADARRVLSSAAGPQRSRAARAAADRWQLKSFAAAGAKKLQLDPELGLVAGMIVEAGGQQYRHRRRSTKTSSRSSPPLEASWRPRIARRARSRRSRRSTARRAIGRSTRSTSATSELLNIEAAATIEIVGAKSLRRGSHLAVLGQARAKRRGRTGSRSRWPTSRAAAGRGRPEEARRARSSRARSSRQEQPLDPRLSRRTSTGVKPLLSRSRRDPHQLQPTATPCPPATSRTTARPRPRRWRTPRRSCSTTCSSRSGRSRGSSTRSISAARKRSRRRARRSSSASRWPIPRSPRCRPCARARLRIPCSPASPRIARCICSQFNPTTGASPSSCEREPLQPPLPGYLGAVEPGNAFALDVQPRWRLPIWHEVDFFGDGLPGRGERRRRNLGLARGASASNLQRLGQFRSIAGRHGTGFGSGGWARPSWRRCLRSSRRSAAAGST